MMVIVNNMVLFTTGKLNFFQSTTNLLRSTISYNGSSIITSNNFLVQQSVGQNSPVGLQEFSDKVVRQGFIQPSILRRMMVSSKSSNLSVFIPWPITDVLFVLI